MILHHSRVRTWDTCLKVVCLAALATACQDRRSPTESEGETDPLQAAEVSGSSQLARWIDGKGPGASTGRSKVIGPAGGRLEFAGIAVEVPAGAVVEDTEFTIRTPGATSDLAGRVAAHLFPHGTKFRGNVIVEFDTKIVTAQSTGFAISWWNGARWDRQPTFVGNDGVATTEVNHFSLFGLEGLCGPVVEEAENGCREPAPDGGGPGLYVNGWTVDQCHNMDQAAWFVDFDLDGMDDNCERDLAYAFRPLLIHNGHDCNWDFFNNRMGGEYLWGVRLSNNAPTSDLRWIVAYLPAYYSDCGSGAIGGGGFHYGDSELIAVMVSVDESTNRWLTEHVFLSAHCKEPTGVKCRWYDLDGGVVLDLFPLFHPPSWSIPPLEHWVDDVVRGAMEVWVSVNKHANYVTQDDCNWSAGIVWPFIDKVDDCFSGSPRRRFPISMFGNIGQRSPISARLIDCGEGIWYSPMKVPGRIECVWTSRPFFGWQPAEGDGARAYEYLLEQYLLW